MIIRRDFLRATGAAILARALNLARQNSARSDEDNAGIRPEEALEISDRWWPVQRVPKGIAQADRALTFELQMLVQSVAGLAAKAVNQGDGDELVWVSVTSPSLDVWHRAFLKAHSAVENRGSFDPWQLVDRFLQRGVIKGYILYRPDRSEGQTNDHRIRMDLSVNIATSLAGLLDGVLIGENLEEEARAHGLAKLLDVRDKDQAWCFETYKNRFNRRLLCAQDPRKPHVRDLAIAHRALVLYGADEPTESAMKWLEPLSPIIGWNGGDEFETTRVSTIYGHLQTATDWCMNLPVLMAGSERSSAASTKPFDPRSIDWNDRRSCVAFILSDGDNVQWQESSFFHSKSYWGNPHRGQSPFGWSCCFAQLAQLCPGAVDYAWTTKTANDYFVEWGGGYYYPDLFGQARICGKDLLARHARRTAKFMRHTGTQIIAFNVAKVDSPETAGACATIAAEIDDLSAILLFQYSRYESGAGKTYWVKNRRSVEIPVISARYSIWENSNEHPRSGTPAKIAREIRGAAAGQSPRHDWTIVHAWSYFKPVPSADDNAENMPQQGAVANGGVRGYDPVLFCAERLSDEIRVVSPDELVWRIRMECDPTATRKLLD